MFLTNHVSGYIWVTRYKKMYVLVCISEGSIKLILKSKQKDFLPEEDGSLIAFFR